MQSNATFWSFRLLEGDLSISEAAEGVSLRVGEDAREGLGCSSLRMKEMNALTKPFGLNLGRQNGIHDVDAGLLYTDGVLIVLRMMWRSAGWIECFRGRIKVNTRSLATRIMYRISCNEIR